MPKIKRFDCFSIGKDVKLKYRKYIQNHVKLDSDELNEGVKNTLVVDDILTSGAKIKDGWIFCSGWIKNHYRMWGT